MIKDEYEQVLTTGQPVLDFEVQGRTPAQPDRERVWLVSYYPLFGADNEVRAVSSVVREITEERLGQRRLHEQEERFQLLMRATNDVIWDWNLEANVITWSASMREQFGYDPDLDLPVLWWESNIHPDERERVAAGLYRVTQGTGEYWQDEYRFRRSDGRYAEVLDRGSVVRNSDGKAVRMIGSMLNLTAQKLVERDLRTSEATLGALLDSLPVGVVIADAHGALVRDNAAAREIWGEPPVVRNMDDFDKWVGYWPESGDRVQKHEWAMSRALMHGDLIKGELVEVQAFDRPARRAILNNAAPVRDGEGRRIGGVVACMDVTEHLNAQKALRQSESQFRQAAESMPQLVWITDANGSHEWFNQRWYEYTGSATEESAGDGWAQFFHPDDVARAVPVWRHSVSTGELYDIEYRCRRYDGAYRWFIGRALPIRDESGKIVRWFGTCTDIDDQKRTEAELRRANQDLERFAFSASHDLKEPLRNMKIFSELLVRRYEPVLDPQGRQFLGYIVEGAQRMNDLVAALLSYTQAGLVASRHPEPVNANAVLARVLDDLHTRIEETAARLTYGRLPVVSIDPVHLQQLFLNLIGNALKYRQEDQVPRVHLSARQGQGVWQFSVQDNGIGIHPDYHQKVFGIFTRLHKRGEYGGTGIGLALCQKIVEIYGGSIAVESRPGEGSTFTFTIPMGAAALR